MRVDNFLLTRLVYLSKDTTVDTSCGKWLSRLKPELPFQCKAYYHHGHLMLSSFPQLRYSKEKN